MNESELSNPEKDAMNQSVTSSAYHYRVPNINWSETPLFKFYTNNKSKPYTIENKKDADGENLRFTEGEVDYVLDTLKSDAHKFNKTNMMKPFYNKALNTLKYLLEEQTIAPIFVRVLEEYSEMTLENTMKLLIRCKMAI